MTDPTVCARCAQQGPTCCILGDLQTQFCFPLSETERGRIRDVLPDAGGFESEHNSAAFIDSLVRLFPGERATLEALFHPRKEHLRLAVDENGACRFLGPEGCMIPREVRPYYCRLFPFWVAHDKVFCFESSTCLAHRELGVSPRLFKALGMTEGKVRELYGRLRLAWGLPPRPDMLSVKRGF